MPQSAFIKLVRGSTQDTLTLEDVKSQLNHYTEQTSYTGKQLSWDYAGAAFPYTVEQKPEGEGKWFYLKGNDPLMYKVIVVGVGKEPMEAEPVADADDTRQERHFIQVVLPDGSQHGDKAKANEFCKYLAKKFKAELHLFNGRVMRFNPLK